MCFSSLKLPESLSTILVGITSWKMFYFPVSSIPPDRYCHELRTEVCSEWEQTSLSSQNGKFFGEKKLLKITYQNSPSLFFKRKYWWLKKKIKGKQVIESSWLSCQQKLVSESQSSSEPLEINGVELTWSLQQFCAQVLFTNLTFGDGWHSIWCHPFISASLIDPLLCLEHFKGLPSFLTNYHSL